MSSDAEYAGPPEPWDIGRPQPAVQQLVACGALRGEVLDPGTGPGHHAIYYAAQGHSTTAVDHAPAAIELAERNAEAAGVTVNFQVADAVELAGFHNRFDTVVDSAFFHAFSDDEDVQSRYLHNLHRATRPGARLFMFEAGRHNVNGWQLDGQPAEAFARLLPGARWRLDFIGATTYQGTFDPNSFTEMLAVVREIGRPDLAEGITALHERFRILEPLLEDNLVHMPFWSVAATRVD